MQTRLGFIMGISRYELSIFLGTYHPSTPSNYTHEEERGHTFVVIDAF